eukprot:8041308-Pyramimonas_sp.AAC.1
MAALYCSSSALSVPICPPSFVAHTRDIREKRDEICSSLLAVVVVQPVTAAATEVHIEVGEGAEDVAAPELPVLEPVHALVVPELAAPVVCAVVAK